MAVLDRVVTTVRQLLGTTNEAAVRRLWPQVRQARALEAGLQALDDADLRKKFADLRVRVRERGETLEAVLVEALAITREAADRRIGMWNALDAKRGFPDAAWGDQLAAVQALRAQLSENAQKPPAEQAPAWTFDLPAAVYARIRAHSPNSVPPFRMRAHDVQILGAIVLHQGKIAEMKTGEGKTLVASLACALNALAGTGVHVITVNDYLASRDAAWNAPTLQFLGVTVGAIQSQMPPWVRKDIYARDVVYGTNNEYGFDYLRDNLARSLEEQVQTRRHFAVVDEVDSVLIDEARTPLIISGPATGRKQWYEKADEVARGLVKGEHFEVDIKDRHVTLTEAGMDKAADAVRRGIALRRRAHAPAALPRQRTEGAPALPQGQGIPRQRRRRGEDHRRAHRPHPRWPALVRRPAPGGGGQGAGRDPGREPDLRARSRCRTSSVSTRSSPA